MYKLWFSEIWVVHQELVSPSLEMLTLETTQFGENF